MRVFYLHGFASSPRSRKALFFAARLAECGIALEIPDLAQGDFEHLTMTGQLALLETLLGTEAGVLIGSSLGGYLAALYAARHPTVARAVLLAPAFGVRQLWEASLPVETIARWKRESTLPFFHYGEGREVPLSYAFFEDTGRYEPFPNMGQPALLFHGDDDSVVPVEQSLAFVQQHPNDRLVRLSSGHELTDVLGDIWKEAAAFLLGKAEA